MDELKLVKQTIKFPVRYDQYGQKIFDADDNFVADIRGWGRIQKMSNAEERQDAIGRFIADAMNTRPETSTDIDKCEQSVAGDGEEFYSALHKIEDALREMWQAAKSHERVTVREAVEILERYHRRACNTDAMAEAFLAAHKQEKDI